LKKMEIDMKDYKVQAKKEITQLRDKLMVERKKRMNLYEERLDKHNQLYQEMLEKDQQIYALKKQINYLTERVQ
jgi:hypothetical protein